MLTFILIAMSLIISMGLGMLALYRMHGGAPPSLPWKLDEILISCYIAIPAIILLHGTPYWYYILTATIGITALMKVKGHGQYMNFMFLPPWKTRIKPETWDIFLKPIFGEDPRTAKDWTALHALTKAKRLRDYGLDKLYWRCTSGLFISGASVSIGLVGVLLYTQNYLLALAAFLSFGIAKSVSYTTGWRNVPDGRPKNAKPEDLLDEATEIGEAGSGLGVGMFLGALVSFLLYSLYF